MATASGPLSTTEASQDNDSLEWMLASDESMDCLDEFFDIGMQGITYNCGMV